MLRLSLLLSVLVIAPAVYATCGGGGGGGGGSQQSYTPTWTEGGQAKESARRAVYGIVYYFPPGDGGDVHGVFHTKALSEQSRKSPMVLVTAEEREEMRAVYKVDKKHPTLVVTDWFGNFMEKFEAKSLDQKLDIQKIITLLKSAESWVAGLRKKAVEKLKSGEKSFEKQAWAAAVKDLGFVAGLKGFEECEKAGELLEAIEEEGRKRIEAAKHEGIAKPADAVKSLRKIASEFKGCAVEREAEEAIAALKKTAFEWTPEPPASDEYEEYRRSLPWAKPDERAVEEAFAVQALVTAGAELERAHLYDEARRAWEAAHDRDSDDPVPLRYLGEHHRHHTGDWERARAYFDTLLALEDQDGYSRAIALHGLGKMTINSGRFAEGLALLEQSVSAYPTQIAYRNLAVYWNSESARDKARGYMERAVALDPTDPYTRVFEAVYIAAAGNPERALEQVHATATDPSMNYNIACVYSTMRDKERTIEHLRRHFFEYETTDLVRAKEMLEARSDILFQWLFEDPDFLEVTALAAKR